MAENPVGTASDARPRVGGLNGHAPGVHTEEILINGWNDLPWDTRLRWLLDTNDIGDWTSDRGYPVLGYFRYKPSIWVPLCARARVFYIGREQLESATDDWLDDHPDAAMIAPRPEAPVKNAKPPPRVLTDDWRKDLVYSARNELKQTAANISLLLEHHPDWFDAQGQHRLWLDVIRGQAMQDDSPVTDQGIIAIMRWLQIAEHMPTTMHKLVERCVIALCHQHPRDLLQTMLLALPVWDGVPRLETWLEDCAGVTRTLYSMAVSKMLLISMVARVMDPGCLYRYVVILEGPEEYKKSTLVQALAGGSEWYVSLAIGLDTKESHMMLQGAWVAEMPELDSLSRTEETRMKAFITMKEDSYIPKYSNFRLNMPRRTIFVGTTNEESYLKGQTGNTRYLPLALTQPVEIADFLAIREQLLAEALAYYQQHSDDWWLLPEEALTEAQTMREARRLQNVYEDALQMWLDQERYTQAAVGDGIPYMPKAAITTWQEIAKYFLRLEKPADWKDAGLQRQISAALRALGWSQKIERDPETKKAVRIWRKNDAG